MSESMLRSEREDQQRAFVGLLAAQLVAPWTDPPLHILVHRHVRVLTTWCGRLGYRLGHIDQCYRLRRVPVEGTAAVPDGAPPPRSELLLLLYSAACLDDHRMESITLQEISDVVHLSTAGLGGWIYDPNLRSHRRQLVAALDRLVGFGVLERRTEEQFLDSWERAGEGIGAGYVLHRDALTLLIDTGDVDLALARRAASPDDTRGTRLLRRLVETQAILVDELPRAEQEYLVGQRSRLASLAEQMTGGAVEIRSDAIILVLPPDRGLPGSVQLDFPAVTTVDWVSLRLLDDVARAAGDGGRRCLPETVARLARDLHDEHSTNLTKELRTSPEMVQQAAKRRLSDLGLLRVLDDGAWELTPLAGRFRDAELRTPQIEDTPLFPEAP